MVVCQTGISRLQKIVLSNIFLLIGFIIGVTIVRASIFGGTYKSVANSDRQVMDSSWIIFWFLIEYLACESFVMLVIN